MSKSSRNELQVEPVLGYPREAQINNAYLLTVDLRLLSDPDEWPEAGGEEVVFDCLVNSLPLFRSEPLGGTAIVMHRFGGTYGPARFLLTASSEAQEGTIQVTLVNGWGVPLMVLETATIRIHKDPSAIPISYKQLIAASMPVTSTETALVRWLHLSDFHVGRENYDYSQVFKNILRAVEYKIKINQAPDIIFISGDIASHGLASEYNIFINNFMFPLMELLGGGWEGKVIAVPGNHDIDRNCLGRVRAHDLFKNDPSLLEPTARGLAARRRLVSKFEPYIRADLLDSGGSWLLSPEGAFVSIFDVRGYRIGVLGVNTAWLSEDSYDLHQLTPGKAIVENGLEKIRECDARFVLGHHPIDWFTEGEIDPIKSLFDKFKVMYLHGQLHQGVARYEITEQDQTLILQAGVSFQSREKGIWSNRLLWCELDFNAQQLDIQPLIWSAMNRDWMIDTSAFPERYRKPGSDHWILPSRITGAVPLTSAPVATRGEAEPILPLGWLLIDEGFLTAHRQDLNYDQALRYFGGGLPGWAEALAPSIPRRAVVGELVSELNDPRRPYKLTVTMLLGPAGEGKSTVLKQVICDLVSSNRQWRVLWRNDPDAQLSIDLLLKLQQSDKKWLIASDDADSITGDVFEAVKALYEHGRRDFIFLLASRETDWKLAKGESRPWQKYATYLRKHLKGLSKEDALLIVAAWSRYGRQVMGNLADLNLEDAALSLVDEARSEQSGEEGSLLGALLRGRIAQDINNHIEALLLRLKNKPAPGGSLLDAFARIAAMHSENLKLLTREVLAEALGCNLQILRQQVLDPLKDEATITTEGRYIMTRHRAIASSAVEILSRTFQYDIDEIFLDLAWAAFRSDKSGLPPHITPKWSRLPIHFLRTGRKDLSLRLARSLFEMNPRQPEFLIQYAYVLREIGQIGQSVDMFRAFAVVFRNNRAVYLEWAKAEAANNNFATGAWLAGVSLADDLQIDPLGAHPATSALSVLVTHFSLLFEAYQADIFRKGAAASAQLGLLLAQLWPIPRRVKARLQRSQSNIRKSGIQDVDTATALQRLEASLTEAWVHAKASLPLWVKKGDELTLDQLKNLLESDLLSDVADQEPKEQQQPKTNREVPSSRYTEAPVKSTSKSKETRSVGSLDKQAGVLTLYVTNEHEHPRSGHVICPWMPIYEKTGIEPHHLLVMSDRRKPLPSQVDNVFPDDPSSAVLLFSLEEDVLPGQSTTVTVTGGRRSTPLRDDYPRLEVEAPQNKPKRVQLINDRLSFQLQIASDPWDDLRNWYAGSVTNLILDGREMLDLPAQGFREPNYDVRCMQIDRLMLSPVVEEGRKKKAPRPDDQFNLIQKPYRIIQTSSGPVRASVTIASSPIHFTTPEMETQTETMSYRLYRILSLYKDANYILEELKLIRASEMLVEASEATDLHFQVRYFSFMNFGLEPFLNKHDNYFVVGNEWFPNQSYGFASSEPIAGKIQMPSPEFPPSPGAEMSFSWTLAPSAGATCLHLFTYNQPHSEDELVELRKSLIDSPLTILTGKESK